MIRTRAGVPSGRSADSNRNAYDTDSLVRSYAADRSLQKPEYVILELLRDQLAEMRMLDIGVGPGRTTAHFGPLVKEYVGIDYSPKMIEACRREFRDATFAHRFEVCDARDLHIFGDGIFDLILFSFNGIDLMEHNDRLACFREIRRVGRRGGYFCFSSHNLAAAMKPFSLRRTGTILAIPRWIFRRTMFILRNQESLRKIQSEDHVVLNDTADRFRLRYYYIRPKSQVRQLHDFGFQDIRLFGRDGREVPSGSEPPSPLPDSWIYYLCRM